MYCKIDKKTETGQKLISILKKCQEVRQEAIKVAEKYGAKNFAYACDPDVVGGGLSCLELETFDDTIWRQKYYRNYYYPRLNKKGGKQIAAEFNALPVVTRREYDDCVKSVLSAWYENDNGKTVYETYGLKYTNDFILIEFNSKRVRDTLPADWVEITETEYNNFK